MKIFLTAYCFLAQLAISATPIPSINFSQESYQDILAEAKRTNKPIFIDFYASWCGPCKVMENEVFSDEEVGDYMNEHFLSIRIDAENDESALVEKHEIKAYPTLAFLSPTGRMVFSHEGAQDKDVFLQQAMDLINQRDYSIAYSKKPKRYEEVANYARSLKLTNPSKANKIVLSFLKDEPYKKWITNKNWELIREFVKGTNLVTFRKILSDTNFHYLYKKEFLAFVLEGSDDLIDNSLARQNTYHLDQLEKVANQYTRYFDDSDSLILAARLRYAEQYQPQELPVLFKRYLDSYSDSQALLRSAFILVEKHFDREILELAIKWAKESLRIKETALANVVIGLAYEKLNDFQPANAYMVIALKEADEQTLPLIEEHLGRISEKMSYEENSVGVNVGKNSQELDDGRFTLGAGSKRLMYGYPIPTSTSHFIVNINGKLATNSPKLATKGLTYLSEKMSYDGNGMTPEVIISFTFENVSITQKLEPVDQNFHIINSGLAQYYKVSYQFESKDRATRKIGLGVLFDTMIEDNDDCVIAADGKILETEWAFGGTQIPRNLLFYKTAGDTSDMMGAAVIQGNGATRPDKMVVGRWPVLHEVTWELKPKKVKYGDSAYFLKWENRKLSPGVQLDFVTYYGLPSHKKAELRLIIEDHNLLTKKANIYFPIGSDEVDLNSKMMVNELLDNPNIRISGVLLNGYADISGTDGYNNFELSKRRIENVGKLFSAYGIPFVPKPYGTDKSNLNELSSIYGNVWDRKVQIIIYYKIGNLLEN